MVDPSGVGTTASGGRLPRIPVWAMGLALSIFLVVTYILCALFLILFPDVPVSHSFLGFFVPWFKPLSWYDLLNGLMEAFVEGWYIALVFGMLYNFFVARFEREARQL